MEKLEFTNANRIWRFIVGSNHVSIIVLNLAVTSIVAAAAILRYVFTKDMSTYEEYLIPIAFWLYMMGGINGSIEKSHITADFVSAYMKEGMRKDLLNIGRQLFTIILSSVFTIWAFKSVVWYIGVGQKSPVWHIPYWLAFGSIFVGMLFMTIFHLVHFIHDTRQFRKKYFDKAQIEEH